MKFRVAHIITRLIIGGAQENTLLTVEDQHRLYGDEVTLITGPGLGPEGAPRAPRRSRFLGGKRGATARIGLGSR